MQGIATEVLLRSYHLELSMATSVKTNITEFVLIFESIKYKSLPSSVVPVGDMVVMAVKLVGIERIA